MMYVVCCDTSIGSSDGRSAQIANATTPTPTTVATAAIVVRRASFAESVSLI
jgi:hypothetical protein